MTVSLVGGHFTENGLGQGYPARAVLSLNGNGLDEQHPDTIILFRDTTVYSDGPSDLHTHPLRRTIEYARWWYSDRNDGPTLRQVWTANRHRVHYFVITNEKGGNDPEHIQDHIAYEANICQLAAADGFKCAVGKLAGDSPGWPTGLWQQYYAPFVTQAWTRYGAIYARHVYGGNLVDGNGNPTHDQPGNPSRPFDEVAHLRTLGYGGGMVLAECGLDGGYGRTHYGRFRVQALGYAAALRPLADMLIGLCWWEAGETEFEANYTAYLQQLRSELDTTLPKWTPAVAPPPTDKPKIVIVKKPQKAQMTLAENQYVGEWAWNNYGRTTTHSTNDMLSMLATGNTESYAVIAYPDRQQDDIVLLTEAGYAWQPMPVDGSPLAGLRLGHLFAYRYQYTSHFNDPRDYDRDGNFDDPHEGADLDFIGGKINNTEMVLCAYDGVVERSVDSAGNYGKYVRVRHTRNGKPFLTWYCHLDSRIVQEGQNVTKGQPVGEIGISGNVTGEHVHFNLVAPGYGATPPPGKSPYAITDVVDPAPYLPTPAEMAALPPVPTASTYDMANYIVGKRDGRAMQFSSGETMQYQEGGGFIYLVKNSQWEQFRIDGSFIWRGKDTSPGPAPQNAERPGAARWYWQRDAGQNAARWCARMMSVGQVWTGAGHHVQFYYKSDCTESVINSGNATNRLTLVAHHASRSWGNITMNDVIECTNSTGEAFWFARDWGMVAWASQWGSSNVIELFQPGQRTLTREAGCFG